MNYIKLYNAFIENFKNQMFQEGEYTEVHHILPRYAGGTDDSENLVRLTYRQHVFVHKLWYKATGDLQAKIAVQLMTGIPSDKKVIISSMAGSIGGKKNVETGHMQYLCERYGSLNGRRNVESGHLDRIRVLANTPVRQQKLKLLHETMRENGMMSNFTKAGNAAWKGSHHTEEFKKNRSDAYKERFRNDPSAIENMMKAVSKSADIKKQKTKQRSDELVLNAERNEEFLHKTSSKSLNKFISPEGLIFDSPIFAAKYYGNGVTPATIEYWCKQGLYGWKREPKTVHD